MDIITALLAVIALGLVAYHAGYTRCEARHAVREVEFKKLTEDRS